MVWAIWQGYLLLNQEQMGLPPNYRSMVIIFSILLLIVAFTLTMAIGNLGDKKLKASQFAFRYSLYEKLMVVYQQAIDALPDNQVSKLGLNIGNLEQQLQLLAPAKVLKAFNDLQKYTLADGVHSTLSKEAWKKLLLAMRDDLGQPADYLIRKEFQNMIK